MTVVSRRTALRVLTAGGLATVPGMARAAKPRVLVVGGGAGGATAARQLALDDAIDAEIVLIEPSRSYHTCFFSNHYIGGLRDYGTLVHQYDRLASLPGLTVVHDWARSIDRAKRTVELGSGDRLSYDRLIVSPGIDLRFDAVPGYSVAASGVAPHAWKSGSQLQLLKARALAMKPGGTYVYMAPPDPSRCPPGPYERVSMLANLFRTHNPTAKIVILDSKEKFAKQTLFQTAWETYYPDMILWLPPSISGGLTQFDAATLTFTTELEDFKADAASIVPPQRAAEIAVRAGLTDASGWVPVDPRTFRSAADRDVFVIGDAAIASAMPKSAFAANNQAKVAAHALRQSLLQRDAEAPVLANTCWSLLAPNDSVKIGASYTPDGQQLAAEGSFISQTGESAAVRASAAREAEAWYDAVTRDMLG